MFIGVILKSEIGEINPEIVKNGQNILQYARLPIKKVRIKPSDVINKFSPIIHPFLISIFDDGFHKNATKNESPISPIK